MNAPLPATLEIFRDTTEDVQDRWVRISIDDAPDAILRYGETLRWQLPPGRHDIRAHNTLSKDRLALDVLPGEVVRVRCHNALAKGGILMMLTIGFAFIKVRLEVIS